MSFKISKLAAFLEAVWHLLISSGIVLNGLPSLLPVIVFSAKLEPTERKLLFSIWFSLDLLESITESDYFKLCIVVGIAVQALPENEEVLLEYLLLKNYSHLTS